MCSVSRFVGLDYHQDSVQVCVLDSEGKLLSNRSVANDAATIAQAATRHGRPNRGPLAGTTGASRLRGPHEAFARQDRLGRRAPAGRPGPRELPAGSVAGAGAGAPSAASGGGPERTG